MAASKASAPPPRILHLFSEFEAGPAPARVVELVNALGGKAEHAIFSDDRERRAAAAGLAKGARVSWPRLPPLRGSKLPGRLMKLAGALAGYDLICTYGPGALDAALAHTLFADVHKLAPLVHHELDPQPQDTGRAWGRRLALGRSAALVVASRAMEAHALSRWDQPRSRVRLIPPGIDTRAFAQPAKRDLLPGLIKRKDEAWLGAFADGLGEDPLAVVGALAALPPRWQLVIAGETPSRGAIETEAASRGIEDRVHFPPAPRERAGLLALFDALLLPGDVGGRDAAGERRILEAMAAGLPLVAPRGGGADGLLASENGPLLFAPDDAGSRDEAIARLAVPGTSERVAKANRDRARAEFDSRRMVERQWALYAGLTGRARTAERAGAD